MKIKSVSITNQVVEYLKENIESGDWVVGEKIPSENKLVEELGVSRSSIRTAVQYLIGLGVLKSYQGKGTYLVNSQVENWDETENKITSEDCKDIRQVLEFRKILEPGACRLAVGNCTDETIAALETYLEQMKIFQGDREKFVRADLKFHEVICRTSGNSLLEKSLHKVFVETRKNHEQMNELFGYDSGIFHHAAILEAFRNADGQSAYDSMEQHLKEALGKIPQ
ncbi:MAG: FadR family transcriptional regulator [Dorea sp.]|nr:FadR family transcriptional regulator [Dorea sp.]